MSHALHSEYIRDFVLFLRSLNVSTETQKTILAYQYGDGTLDGSGTVRLSHEQLLAKMENEIREANRELNRWEIVEKVIERFIFNGPQGDQPPVDYLVFGCPNQGVIISRERLMEYARQHPCHFIKTLHFGPITIRPYLRDPGFASPNPQKRFIIHGDWPYLLNHCLEAFAQD